MRPAENLPVDVRALLERPDGSLLITRTRPEPPALWSFPGGVAVPNESPEAALRRVCRDDLRADIDIVKGQWPIEEQKEGERFIFRYYFCRLRNEPALENHPRIEARWVLPAQLREYDFVDYVKPVVDWLIQNPTAG